ncbi:MAG: LruC domain-containing protein [Bacteroidetes bacterium]|nr:LruC domain-containing protein [Bacteroidota bacterium]
MQSNPMKSLFYGIVTGLLIISFTSCVKEIDEYQAPDVSATQVTNMNDLLVPSGFNFNLDREVTFEIRLKNNTDGPISKVVVDIMTDIPENNGKVLFRGATNATGIISGKFKALKTLNQFVINTDYIGITNNAVVTVNNNHIQLSLGGSNPQKVLYKDIHAIGNGYSTSANRTSSIPNKLYLGTWNSQGVPNYMEPVRDIVSSDLLSRINYSLPERQPVPLAHPEYIAINTASNLEITQTADVWMTFVHEGAGYRNSIGYYKYHKNNPPASTSDITNIHIVFPNLSYQNSGGGLVSGDKVYLGNCGPDSMIGFVLLADAFSINNSQVGNGNGQYYSNDDLNPETTSSLRSHNVLLWDAVEEKMIIAFEDLHRGAGSDDDFNDALFYVTTNPSAAISTNRVNPTANPNDTDGDGVDDLYDEYPLDFDLAYNDYYPSANTFGYLAFEDLWPFRGDYDMNDLLIGYRMNSIRNANNEVIQIQSKIFVKAAGGSFQHGFGIELPIPPSFIESVNGPILTENFINVNGNGTEAGQTNAVVVVFDNSTAVAPRPAGYYINTEPGSPVVASDTIRLAIRFISGISPATLGTAPYNPFLISNKRRGYEIHMANYEPTDLADPALFNTGQDRTNQAMGRYYKSDRNLPWCINIPGEYGIVIEKAQIMDAYLKFADWSQSGGTLYNNWYSNEPGFRDPTKILIR